MAGVSRCLSAGAPARGNARRDGREREFDDALAAFCREWNLGTDDQARFEQEYLLAVGRRV